MTLTNTEMFIIEVERQLQETNLKHKWKPFAFEQTEEQNEKPKRIRKER